jgi:cytoskeletal protein CcmA (bactofilin family)
MSVQDRPDHTGTIYVQGSVQIPVAIESSTVTFDVHISSSDVVFQATVTASEIMMPVDIQAQYITLDINIAASAVTLDINITASEVTLNVNITNTTINVAGTVSISGTVTVTGSVTVSGTVSISGTVTVSGTVAISGTVAVSGTVNISGTVTITGTVNISGTVTITGSVSITGVASITITAQTVGVSIQGEWQSEQGNLKTRAAAWATLASGGTGNDDYTVPAGKRLFVYGATFATRSQSTGADNPQEVHWYLSAGGVTIAWGVIGEGQQTCPLVFSAPVRCDAANVLRLSLTNIGASTGYVMGSWWGYEKTV